VCCCLFCFLPAFVSTDPGRSMLPPGYQTAAINNRLCSCLAFSLGFGSVWGRTVCVLCECQGMIRQLVLLLFLDQRIAWFDNAYCACAAPRHLALFGLLLHMIKWSPSGNTTVRGHTTSYYTASVRQCMQLADAYLQRLECG
jgi:hypothetical protein